MNNYTILHLHSMFSNAQINIDSITSFDEYIIKAKECGMKSIAFTEHGNVLGWVKKKEFCEKNGLKYIHGIEIYVTENLSEKVRDNYHCTLIAKNFEGVKEINELSSRSFNRNDGHFYYVPRITYEELINTSDNIYVLTACLGGILNKGNIELQKNFVRFLLRNKHRCFLEIQHHNVDEQIKYNQKLYKIHKKTGVPLIVGTDTHALNMSHMDGRRVLQKAKDIRFADEDMWDLEFKTYEQLIESFKKQNSLPMDIILKAVENTNKLAANIEEFTLDKTYKYPHLWDNPEAYFKKRINEGAKWRGIQKRHNYADYKRRILEEFDTYKHNGAIDFILLMDDVIQWCKKHGIKTGYGRGSVNGSIICYLLGITEMDSVRFGLNFSRFMNPERISLADIDTDVPPSRVQEVKEYVFNKHGLYCCDIVTFNTIADKGAVRDVCRGLYKDDTNVNYLDIANYICENIDSNDGQMREKYPEVFKYVDLVKGTIISIGSHPCGLCCSPIDISKEFGVLTTSTDPYPVSQINMKEIDGLNYVKLDLLKLDTIEIINETCEMAKIERVTPDNINANDKDVWNSIRENTVGIFQWESSLASDYIKKLMSDETIDKFTKAGVSVDKMSLFSIGNAALRPAGASYRDDLASGTIKSIGAKPIDEFLSNTFGFLTYQEEIIEFLHEYCGFTMGLADEVRRGFAKKLGTDRFIPIIKNGGEMNGKQVDGYIKTMKDKYNIPEAKSEKDISAFLRVIEDASNYLFSLNHSLPYSYMGYAAGYLRFYYPLEFLTAALNNTDNDDKQLELIKYANEVNIKLMPPRFRHSVGRYMYSKEDNAIYKGIASIKYMNEKVSNELYALKDNKYEDFVDLLIDLKNTSLDSRQLNILTEIGFFEEFGDVNTLLSIIDIFDLYQGKKIIKKNRIENEELIRKYAVKETAKQFKIDDINPLIKELASHINKTTTIEEMLKYEIKHLGYCQSIFPNESRNHYLITSVKKGRSITNIGLYEIYSGKNRKVKMWSSQFDRNPFEIGDIMAINSLSKQNQKQATNEVNSKTGKRIWVDIIGKYEYWLKQFSIIK